MAAVDAGGRTGHVNIEVAMGNHQASSIRAKAAAGFRLDAGGSGAERMLARVRTTGPGR